MTWWRMPKRPRTLMPSTMVGAQTTAAGGNEGGKKHGGRMTKPLSGFFFWLLFFVQFFATHLVVSQLGGI